MNNVLTRDETVQSALRAPTLTAAFETTAQARAGAVAIRTRAGDVVLTWGDYRRAVGRAMAVLRGLGIGHGDRIALLLTNRPEFHVLDCAALRLGAVPVSVYPTAAPEQVQHVVDDARAHVIVTEASLFDTAARVAVAGGGCSPIVVDDEDSPLALARLLDDAVAWDAVEPAAVDSGDLATLIYTSGTTGLPKGVRITHGNAMAAARSYAQTIAFPQQARIVSYLPLAHIAERNVSHYLPMVFGFDVTCCPSPGEVLDVLAEVRPSWFFGVPRIWEKLKTRIELDLDAATGEAVAASVHAVRASHGAPPPAAAIQAGLDAPAREALAALRARHGLDALSAANIGAAPTPSDVLEFFHAIGVPLSELWGMSETTGLGTVSPVDAVRFHTVGKPAPGVEIAIGVDGEVLIRGDVVTAGYENRPDATAEALDAEGWLHTGDTGRLTEGYLEIIGRKKELIITAAGENISPVLIEAALTSADPLIAHACVIGDRRRHIVALISLDADVVEATEPRWLRAGGGVDVVAARPRIEAAVAAANARLARVQQVKRFLVLEQPFTVGAELTPTMKIKRTAIEQRYAAEIEALYQQGEPTTMTADNGAGHPSAATP